MGPAWFILGLLAAQSCREPTARERRAARNAAVLAAREDEKEERRQRVFRAWEKRHPGVMVAQITALIVLLAAFGLMVTHCTPMHLPTLHFKADALAPGDRMEIVPVQPFGPLGR